MDVNNIKMGPAERKRWYILIVFSITSALQCNTWFTFSAVPDQVVDYYHLKRPASGQVNSTIDLFLNWGPILFFPAAPVCAYILSWPMLGLRLTTKIAVTLLFLANVVRCIPSFLDQLPFIHFSVGDDSIWLSLVFLHIAQILNAIAGPFVMAPPSKLSVIWFPESQRTTATAIAAMANTAGNFIGFLLGPLIVSQPSDVPTLLYVDLALATIPFICIMAYFPIAPTNVPTIAAKNALLCVPVKQVKDQQHVSGNAHVNERPLLGVSNEYLDDVIDEHPDFLTFRKHVQHFGHELYECLCNYSAMITVIVGGLEAGTFAAYSSVLQDMVSPLGLSDTGIGFMGVIFNLCAMLGGILCGPLADRYFAKRLRRLIYILFAVTLILLGCLLFMLPNPFGVHDTWLLPDDSSVQTKNIALNICFALLGIFEGALVPLFYELSASISYPVSEGTIAMWMVLINNFACFVLIGVGNWLNTKYETLVAIVVCSLGVLAMTTIKEQYKRK